MPSLCSRMFMVRYARRIAAARVAVVVSLLEAGLTGAAAAGAVEGVCNCGVDRARQRSIFELTNDRVRLRRGNVVHQGLLVGDVDAVVLSVEEPVAEADDRIRLLRRSREVAGIDVELAPRRARAERVPVAALAISDVGGSDLREGLRNGRLVGRIDEDRFLTLHAVLKQSLTDVRVGRRGPRAFEITRGERSRLDRCQDARVAALTDEVRVGEAARARSGPQLIETVRPGRAPAGSAVRRLVIGLLERDVARRIEVVRVKVARAALVR